MQHTIYARAVVYVMRAFAVDLFFVGKFACLPEFGRLNAIKAFVITRQEGNDFGCG